MAVGWLRPRVNDVVFVAQGGLEKIKRIAKHDGNRIYIVGDNPSSSTDSRDFGWIEKDAVIAKVIWSRRVKRKNFERS